jgi:hypothetical protein
MIIIVIGKMVLVVEKQYTNLLVYRISGFLRELFSTNYVDIWVIVKFATHECLDTSAYDEHICEFAGIKNNKYCF